MENCKNRQRLMDQDTRPGAVHTEGGFYNAGDAGRGEGPSPKVVQKGNKTASILVTEVTKLQGARSKIVENDGKIQGITAWVCITFTKKYGKKFGETLI